jgi:Archaea-specific RecJ-like exonuclease, contains DnaJ-type Zn finger domain
MSLYSKYYAQINSWNWNSIVINAKNNQYQDDDNEDCMIGSCCLGSMINPSGKFYMPFAYSNLDSCKSCNGTGINSRKVESCHICNGTGKRYLKDCEKFPAILEWIKKDSIPVYDDFMGKYFICNLCQGKRYNSTTCKQCGGLGSNEAYNDQEFFSALDDIAEKHGGYITSGEGDPCDTYFCMSIDKDELESETIE